ncbi:MAG: FAD-binding protein, partial [Anaerolineae bacterium]|nr:FAD-binding protein [Anaerolineae bacterium]
MDMAFAPAAQFDQHLLADLRAQIQGDVVTPGEADYDRARMAWNLSVDQHPEVIVVAHSAADVAAAVRFARAAHLGVAMQSTGHGVARPADNAVLIITSNLKEICVDADARIAWIEAG